ncbi:MAG TPA: ACP S-malonyltransferase [Casimicrobiaceae bacterium]|nr:ACP S-malonyltransferase [Casimicrobiaceae bacterium]
MKLAFLFPGQGSQSVGMMSGYAHHPAVRATFAEASDVLGEDLWALVSSDSDGALDRTVNTQPVMLTAGVAVWRAWLAAGGPRPDIVAGHSLGEYTALVAAGALAFHDAVPLVRFRAQAMQEAVPAGVGAMAAVMGLDEAGIAAACAEAAQGEAVEAVNFNAPGQIVIAGHAAAVERAIAACKARGAKRGVLLPVSAPFHSSLMKPAAERLAARLAEVAIAPPEIPVLHNVDVALHRDAAAIRSALARQAASPVRWVETVQAMAARGVTRAFECGPGRVLTGLCKRIAPGLEGHALDDGDAIAAALAALDVGAKGGSA